MAGQVELSRVAMSNGHGEDSPYFDGWKEYEMNPYHPTENPSGVIQMGLAENQVSHDLLEEWLKANTHALTCSDAVDAIPYCNFRHIANYQDYHGLPAFRQAIASFMEKVRGNKAKFDEQRIVMAAGATAASEVLTFCIANPGEAFLVPTPYYPGFDRDLRWRTGVEIVPVPCTSHNGFRLTESALRQAYNDAISRNIRVKAIWITNPSNPLGTTMDAETLKMLLCFATETNIHLICDEIYSGTVFSDPPFVSIAEILSSLPEDIAEIARIKNRVHIVYSLSKDMGLPGFRVGVLYSYNDDVVKTARRMSSFSLVSSQTQHLIACLLSDQKFVAKYLSENCRRLRDRHCRFVNGLREAGIECLPGNAGLFSWVDLRGLMQSEGTGEEMKLWKRIVKEVGLNVSPGMSCHCVEGGWFRFCFANMTEHETYESLRRIRGFAASLRIQSAEKKLTDVELVKGIAIPATPPSVHISAR